MQLFHLKKMDDMRELMISSMLSFISGIPYTTDVNSYSDPFGSAVFDGKWSETCHRQLISAL